MTVLVASDLDRTLIYSLAAAEKTSDDGLVCVEHYENAPLSYVSVRSAARLAELAAETVFVPVTTRTREQYGRIRLPIPTPRYAICVNGGHILADGVPDLDWHRSVLASVADGAAPLAEVRDHLESGSDPSWTLKRRQAEDLFCYLVVERAALPLSYVDDLTAWCAERGWSVSMQGRKIYTVPQPLTKSAAVAEVASRSGATATLAAGDSILDGELLAVADAGVRPGHGELADTGWSAAGVESLSLRGTEAGEAIVDWLLDRARRFSAADAAATDLPNADFAGR